MDIEIVFNYVSIFDFWGKGGVLSFIGPVCYTRVADGKINDYE